MTGLEEQNRIEVIFICLEKTMGKYNNENRIDILDILYSFIFYSFWTDANSEIKTQEQAALIKLTKT